MKNTLLIVLFGLMALTGMAQDRVVLLRDTTRLQLSLAELEKKYPPALNRISVSAGITTETKGAFGNKANLFYDTLNARYQQFFTFIEHNKRRLPVLEL